MLFIDLDDFKDVNDFLGHDVGDEILKSVSQTILRSVRENDFVARIGGDEFVVVLPDFKNNIELVEIAQRIIDQISKPIKRDNEVINIGASIGIVVYPKNGKNSVELMKNADIAMYKAKAMGKNQFYFFTSKLNEILHQKIKLQHHMKEALEKGHFKLYYQPKTDIQTGKIVSCEALIR